MATPVISIVLGSYNRFNFLRAAIASVHHNGITVPYEVIVIDGGSSDGSIEWLVKQKDIITIVQHNHGEWNRQPLEKRSWGYYMNIAFRSAHGKYILLISDDNLLVPGSVMNGLKEFGRLEAEGRKIGALAFYWRNWPDMENYWVGLSLGKMFVSFGMFLRQAVEEAGWIDEDTYAFYCADIDLSLKLWQLGYEVRDCKDAIVEHRPLGNESSARSDDPDIFIRKWVDILNTPDKESYIANPANERSWLYLSYVDQAGTARNFPKPIRRSLISRLKKVKQKLRSLVAHKSR